MVVTIDQPDVTVYTRQHWGDDWTEAPYLYCQRLLFATSPTMPRALFRFDYGRLIRPDANSWSISSAQDLDGYFVKVVIDEDTLPDWYGVFVDDNDLIEGRHNAPAGENDAEADEDGMFTRGVELLTAQGLEWLLARERLTRAVVSKDSDENRVYIQRAPGFNEKKGTRRETTLAAAGNMLEASDPPVFTYDLSAGEKWTAFDIINYLVYWFFPGNIQAIQDRVSRNGEPAEQKPASIWWHFADDPDSNDLDAVKFLTPSIDADGRDLRELLDQCCNSRRLATWHLEPGFDSDDPDRISLLVSQFNETEIDLGEGNTIAAAGDQLVADDFSDYDPRQDSNVRQLQITETAGSQFDLLRVQGARAGCVFTTRFGDQSLEGGWTEDVEDLWKKASRAASDYEDLGWDERERLNDWYRRSPALAGVYSAFVVPAEWTGTVEWTEGGNEDFFGEYYCFPDVAAVNEGVDPQDDDARAEFWHPGLRIEQATPLLVGHDYSGDNIEKGTTDADLPDGFQADFRRPFVVIEIAEEPLADDTGDEDVPRFQPVEQTALQTDEDPELDFSAQVRPLTDQPGLQITVGTGGQARIALNHFDPEDPDTEPTVDDPHLDYETIRATVYVLSDQYCHVTWPEQLDDEVMAEKTIVNELLVNMGDRYRLDYVVPGTVVDLDEQGRLVLSEGGYVRDDRPKLREIARVAWGWYSHPRRAMTFSRFGISTALTYDQSLGSDPDNDPAAYLRLGQMIRDFAGKEIDALVTSIECVWPGSPGQMAFTTVRTSFAQMDVRGFFGNA